MHDRVSSCILLLTLFMFLLALTPVADFEGTVTQSATVVSEPENRGICLAGMPHGPITIDGNANFSATALLEGWPGDGSPENTFIIDGLDIDLGGNYGSCITIINTQVSFIIRNCRLTGADSRDWWSGGLGAGILLRDVSNCELVNNKCYSNLRGMFIETSDSITVFNNTCNNNGWGIWLADSDFSTVFNNTCNSNTYDGISLPGGHSNTVSDNTCNSNSWGIWQVGSYYNMVVNNTCNSNEFHGIELGGSYFNMVSDNTCNSNTQYGIYINDSEFNTVSNNICNNNQFSIYLEESHRSIVANNICNNNGIGIYVRASDNNTVADNTCTSNGRHGFYLSDSSYNNMTNNICNNNWIGICLNNSDWNTVANNTCNDNRIGIYLYESYYNIVASNTCFNNNEHDILEEFESGKFVPSVLLLVGLLGITPMAIVVLGPGLRKAFEAWQLEKKKRREAYDEERRRWEADQEARLVEERQERRYKDDITYPGEVRRFTIILRGRSIDLSFWIKMVVIIFILFIIPIEFSYWSSESNGVIWIDSVILDYYDEQVWSNAQIAFSNPSTIAAAFAICLPAIVLNRRIRNQRATESIRDAGLAAFFGTAVVTIYFVEHFPPAELLWLVQTSPDWKLLRFGTLVMVILIILPLIIREASHRDFQAKHGILAFAIGIVTILVPMGMTAAFPENQAVYVMLSLCGVLRYESSVPVVPGETVDQIYIYFSALPPMEFLYYLAYLLLHLLFGFSILRYLKGLISGRRVLLIGISSILLPIIAAFPGTVSAAPYPTILLPIPVLLIMGTIVVVSLGPVVKHQTEFSDTKGDKAAALSHPEATIIVPFTYRMKSLFTRAKRRIAELMDRT